MNRHRAMVCGTLSAVCLLLAGCGPEIDTLYGQRKGPLAAKSVNGTAVLADMFTASGHKVSSARRLSPRLEQRADCIVWFPNDFEPPAADVRDWLETWLVSRSGRTLIYVGRDFDAATGYWQAVQPGAPDDQKEEIQRRLTASRTQFDSDRASILPSEDCEWFTVEGARRPRQVRTLSGDAAWLRDIHPAAMEIELLGRIVPSPDAQVVLKSDGDMLVSRTEFEQSQLFVVANGSFLLNLPLVNHEHRKLAGKLIDAVGPAGQRVVFLESYPGGPPIADDPAGGMRTGLEIFAIWPTNWILLHLVILGIVFCFWRYPIFGRPRQSEPPGHGDFGRHIAAMGELIERTNDRAYAETRLAQYRAKTKMEVKRETQTDKQDEMNGH